ncbi:cellulase family glycosylhydrolase [Cohnella sp. CFH 77786]|uniref:cellulase family glycosylhydrolase n=1 Tax=Cohnella sp. CFH 77786 TaxID=2662265 RepID=UPI001C60ED19|nr:cellulase family glycosylhydrolase [Cohnella sp. CFH 77786]MBW5448550.1 cellulase family glycosylhydrolase [Cohnella sp. CFH 77786]
MKRTARPVRIRMLAVWMALSLGLAGMWTPDAPKAEAGGTFQPTVVRGFNTSAFTGLARAKDVYGANVFRLQLTPRTEAARSGVSISVAWQRQLENMEGALKDAARLGMYVIVDLHEPPLANPALKTNSDAFWFDDANKQLLIDCWKEIAQRFAPYRNNIWGYDLLNEAYNYSELPLAAANWPVWANEITDAIREYDPQTPIIYEVGPGALPRGFIENQWIDAGPPFPVKYQGEIPLIQDDKVIYSVHMYNPFAFSHQGLSTFNKAPVTTDWPDKYAYPGVIGGKMWDKQALLDDLKPVIDFQNKYHVPIYVGEFSAIRWAPGAAQYTRDLIDIFEEHGWSWTYHAYKEWHGWDPEYNETMTSDLNRESAKASEPTDRELILKAYMGRNTFLPSDGSPELPVNLIKNGTFETDTNGDGLADRWGKGPQATASLVDFDGSKAQKVTVSANNVRGIDQGYFAVSDKNRYKLKLRIRVDSGKVQIIHHDRNSLSQALGAVAVDSVGSTEGRFVTKEYEFVPGPNVAQMALWFWGLQPGEWYVDDVEILDLGEVAPQYPPVTAARAIAPDQVRFEAAAHEGRTVVETVYRLVGENGGWTAVPADGVLNIEPGSHVIAFRSTDSAGIVERARAIEWTRETPSAALLLQWVDRYEEWGWIEGEGIASSLRAKLEQGNLRPFVNEVEAQRGKSIREEAAAYFLREAAGLSASEQQR